MGAAVSSAISEVVEVVEDIINLYVQLCFGLAIGWLFFAAITSPVWGSFLIATSPTWVPTGALLVLVATLERTLIGTDDFARIVGPLAKDVIWRIAFFGPLLLAPMVRATLFFPS